MRKLIRLGLVLGVLTAALTCTALAAGTSTEDYTTAKDGCTVVYHAEQQNYTASYTNTIAGNQYALLVVKGTEEHHPINEDTIMYIDQQAATASGVSFTFIPKSTPDCVVLLGGVFADGATSPVTLGTLIGQGVTVSGSVTSYNPGNPTTVELYAAGTTANPVAVAAIPAAAGNGQVTQDFALEGVPTGATYDLKISKAGHTTYWLTGIPVTEGDLKLDVLKLVSGDVDGNGSVNGLDQNEILRGDTYNLTTDEAVVKAADIDGNNLVNGMDINTVLSSENYNRGTVSEEYGK